jgi:(S)-sulfolactate dehydrogenase
MASRAGASPPKPTKGPGGQAPRGLVVEPMEAEPRRRLGRHVRLLYRPALVGERGRSALIAVLEAWRPEVLVVRNETRVDAALIARMPGLRVVGRLGSGLDNIDTTALRARGVAVVHAPGAGAASVAELVFAYLLGVARPLLAADAAVRQGLWPREACAGFELADKRLGIVGLGEIGTRVALRARAFGMRVAATDPGRPRHHFAFQDLGVEPMALDRLLATSRFVTIHVPRSEQTRGLIDGAAIARMAADAHLIVTARGGIVDEAALAEALRAGRIAGAMLDVRESEPPPSPDPLAEVPHLVLTPHIGGLTPEARVRAGDAVVDAILALLPRAALA